ncbi:ABC transporter substrate-binding protein [Microbacterium ulmi]|uniref:ABC transporter substrate-binding protein n=1 Tax=Microbacterium ulmi TaxID=179095 RepID=A0A7Y2LZL0_9MICO|nr:ABC transporter substrate-binding protein [Microbacterium ulmi]NII69185.1 ABC-type branched-subunit amino acid transport system substrate-binding protein [Microbacterium ulmi]NNH03725.1 ABC transporter substrate-binding protein [Microbacterium ulmi]
MSTLTRRALTLAAVVSVAALALTACGRDGGTATPEESDEVVASPGITDDSLLFGISTPLTGTTAGPGNCTADGAIAYFGTKNDEGGIAFGDGKTRTIEIKKYDDEYNPEKSAANFQQMVADGVFAAGIGLGTPTNRAWREAAIEEGVPQVLVMTGDPLFNDRAASPMQLGFVPIYQQEGAAFGEVLAADSNPHKVAILYQNDDYGKGYVEGFRQAIDGAANIEVVKELSYEPSAQSLEGQITELSATGADVLFHAVSIVPLAIENLQKAQSLGWFPSWFLPSNTASPGGVLTPGGAVKADGTLVYPGIYAVAFSEAAAAPPFQESDAGKAYFAAIEKYTDNDGVSFPHCVWSWIAAQVLEQAFMKMEEPTRESFLDALLSIQGFEAQFLLPGGAIDTTVDGLPAVQDVVLQAFNGRGYATVDAFGQG